MNVDSLRELLENVKDGRVDIDEAMNKLKTLPFEDLGFAKLDHHRSLRNGYPEVVYCQGKTVAQVKAIVEKLMEKDNNIMATRAGEDVYLGVKEAVPDAVYYDAAKIIVVRKKEIIKSEKIIAVVTAGTSDIPVAEEAAVTAENHGQQCG
jgi:NCAIR mutase (PurE)-related protein